MELLEGSETPCSSRGAAGVLFAIGDGEVVDEHWSPL